MEYLRNTRYMQYFASFAGTTLVAASAMFIPWASPMLPKLQSDDSPIGVKLTTEEGSWVASSFLITSNLILLIIPFTVEKFGRRLSLLGLAVPLVTAWIIIIFARSFAVLIIGRLIAGFCLGISTVAISMYNGEVAEAEIRGKISMSYTIMRLCAYLLVLAIGPFVSYEMLGLICAIVPIVGLIIFFPMPETPYFLVKVGKREEAMKSLKTLSRVNVSQTYLEKEIMFIEETVQNDMKNKTGLWEFISQKNYRRGLFIMFGVKTLQQLNGNVAVDSYLQTIIADADSTIISPEMCSLLCGVVQIPAAILAAFAIDKFGRKAVLFASAICCGIAFSGEGYYFYLQNTDHDMSALSWLPATGLTFFAIMNTAGCASIPYVLLGEIFPTNVKDVAVALFTTYGGLMAFLVSKFFEPLSETCGRHSVLWFFASISFLGGLFVIVFLPEFKGKTFAEIQMKLNRRKIENIEQEDINKPIDVETSASEEPH